jgi:hypothetical protein
MTANNRIDIVTDVLQVDYEYCSITRQVTSSDNAIDEPVYADKELHVLHYDALTSAFTLLSTLTGGSSGASGVIVAIWEHPRLSTVGTLLLRRDANTTQFSDNETITDAATGSATANGVSTDEFKSSIDVAGVSPYSLIANMRNVVPEGILTQSSHILTVNRREGIGILEGDTVTDENGDTFFILNAQDHQTHVSCLMQHG